jgi:hypothetical protein
LSQLLVASIATNSSFEGLSATTKSGTRRSGWCHRGGR